MRYCVILHGTSLYNTQLNYTKPSHTATQFFLLLNFLGEKITMRYSTILNYTELNCAELNLTLLNDSLINLLGEK